MRVVLLTYYGKKIVFEKKKTGGKMNQEMCK